MNNSKKHECEACGADRLEGVEILGTAFVRCDECGMYECTDDVRLTVRAEKWRPPPTYGERAVRLARLSTYIANPAPTMLEIGCGSGDMLRMAQECGWNAHGIESIAANRQRCVSGGLDCQSMQGSYYPFPADFFDVVAAWHSLHQADDLNSMLAECLRVLKPGGLLAIESADADFWRKRSRGVSRDNFWRHAGTKVFTRKSLRTAATRAGFEVLAGPGFGRLEQLTLPLATYAFVTQLVQNGMGFIGAAKDFRLHFRCPRSTVATRAVRRAA